MKKTEIKVATSDTGTPEVIPALAKRKHGPLQLLQTLVAVYLSRKFIVTMTFGWLLYCIYWNAVAAVYTFESEPQLRSFTTIFQTAFGIFGSIALGYLGFSRNSTSLSSYVSSPHITNRNTKADRD